MFCAADRTDRIRFRVQISEVSGSADTLWCEHPADPESLLLFKNPVTDTVRAGTEDVPSVF